MAVVLNMDSSREPPRARCIWFADECLLVELMDGRQVCVPLASFPKLLNATSEQRNCYEISGDGTGLHWDALDEDISVPNLLGWK